MKTITKEELNKILEEHKLWLDSNEEKGNRADLSFTILRNVNLVDADLRRAILVEADLRRANLRRATLEEADLRDAIFVEANLRKADLSHANLRYADLRHADLSGADLSATDLRLSDLRFSYLKDTDLVGANLNQASTSKVNGLKVYSIDNIGTFDGKVTYIPSLDIVFAGCWKGNLEDFLEKGLEMNKEESNKLEEIKDAYYFFKNRK
ncbi:putative pentapeptide repeat protein [Staphylococcus phage vB_SauM_VL10]|nr:putative pentapeptide repeat protein [Staphylococcus phage vB_SauM_VL10]